MIHDSSLTQHTHTHTHIACTLVEYMVLAFGGIEVPLVWYVACVCTSVHVIMRSILMNNIDAKQLILCVNAMPLV